MIITGTTIKQNKMTFEFYGKKRWENEVWIYVKIDGEVYGPQGSIGLGDPSWELGQGPRDGLVMGTVSAVADKKSKDGEWFIHFKGVIDANYDPKCYDQNVITVQPGKAA